ncbi:MAG: methionyl-tRNA formyltransferase [Candidatus Eisenbacteria bacterium]
MRLIFAGSPAFAVPGLERLLAGRHEVVAVVTQPARPAGRGLVLTDPPVKVAALRHGLEVHQPEIFNSSKFLDMLESLRPDLIVTAAYGRIFKSRALGLPRRGCVNLHASLLPKYRGVAPINWAIINGEAETGVTTFFMEEGVDTGDLILSRTTAILPDETAGELTDRLAGLGAEVLAETCDLVESAKVPRVKQDQSLASYAPKLAKGDGRVGWDQDARAVHNRIRGVNPWPGAFCQFRDQPLKLLSSRLPDDRTGVWGPTMAGGGSGGRAPAVAGGHGLVIGIDSRDGILVSCSSGSVWLRMLQAQGKKPTSSADFARGYRIKIGDSFG